MWTYLFIFAPNDKYTLLVKIGDIELTGSVDDAGFIAFEDLTEEIVLGWATSSIDTSIFETENSASIAQQVIQRAAITTKSGTPW